MTGGILDYAEARKLGSSRAGGKGWHLALLTELGFPVPPALIIDAAASAGHRRGQPIPGRLATTLSQALADRGWNNQPLAVRSSAAHEDSTRASFAGIFKSVLNVRGPHELYSAVAAVWDSLVDEPAVLYRQRLGLPEADGGMAVVVMPLLPAVASGVAFMCDPSSGREDQIVIHASWGLGEAIVSGQVDPDEYRLEETDVTGELRLVESRIGRKARITMASAHGGTALRDAISSEATQAVFTAGQATLLGSLVRETAYAIDYSNPLFDIEWVWDGKQFWIVQARPITARQPYTYPELRDQPAFWSRGNARDIVPDPLSALDWSTYRSLLNRMAVLILETSRYSRMLPGLQRISLRHGRLYNETSIGQWEMYDCFGAQPAAYNRLLGGHQPEISVAKPTSWERLARLGRSIRFLLKCARPRLRADAIFAREHRKAAELGKQHLGSANEIALKLREQLLRVRGAEELLVLQVAGSFLFVLMDDLERYAPGEGHGIVAGLMAGGKPSTTAAQACELARLATLVKTEDSTLAWLRKPDRNSSDWARELASNSPFRRAFASFLDLYGHRAVYESYLRNPRWREDPGYLLDSVLALMTGGDLAAMRERQTQLISRARRRAAEVVPLWYRPFIPVLIKFAIVERNVREAARSALVAHLGIVRRYALAIGQRTLDPLGAGNAEAIFDLTSPEVLALAEGRMPPAEALQRAAWRRLQFERFSSEIAPEVIVEGARIDRAQSPPATKVATRVPGSSASSSLQGVAVGSGRARGPARVAHRPGDALDMAPGSILVAPSTDPSWTPLFLKAGALVTETGGYMSHGAIVARELGIPAVVNVPDILRLVKNGDILDVDGARGVVELLRR